MREPVLVSSKPGASNPWPAQYFLEPSVTMILILVKKAANHSLISNEDLFFLREHPDFGRKLGKSDMKMQ